MHIHLRRGFFLFLHHATVLPATDSTLYRALVCLCVRYLQSQFCVNIPCTLMQPVPFASYLMHTPFANIPFFANSAFTVLYVFYVQSTHLACCAVFLTLLHIFDLPALMYTFFTLYTLLRIFTVFCIYRYTPLTFHSLNILSAFAARIFSSIA